MAHGAIIGCRKMDIILDGSYCSRTIVARDTIIYDAGMIEHRSRKGAWYVTETAVLSGRDVTGIFPGHCTRSIITMTFGAVVNPATMIKAGVSKSAASRAAANAMTYPAFLSRCRMSWCFSGRPGCRIILASIMA